MNNSKNNSNKNFKMSDKVQSENIFSSPGKIALVIAIFLTILLCAFLILKYSGSEKNNILINNESAKHSQELIQKYQKEYKIAIKDFLAVRENPDFVSSSEVCLDITQQTINKVLNLIVPVNYKELHLQTVILFDKEISKCQNKNFENLSTEWNKILENNSWILK